MIELSAALVERFYRGWKFNRYNIFAYI